MKYYTTSGGICPDNSNLVLSDMVVWKCDMVDQTLSKNGFVFLSCLTTSSSRPRRQIQFVYNELIALVNKMFIKLYFHVIFLL